MFGYVNNNAINYVDSTGLAPVKFPKQGTIPGTNIPYRMDLRQEPFPNMHVYWRDGNETVITHRGGWALDHGGKTTVPPPTTHRKALRQVVDNFLERVRARTAGRAGAFFFFFNLGGGIADDYDRFQRAKEGCKSYQEQMCDDYDSAGSYIYVNGLGYIQYPYQGCKGA